MHQVRKTPGWPRSWANFCLLELFSHMNAQANWHLPGQPNIFLAPVDDAPEERLLLAGQTRLRLRRHDTAMGDTVILAENASNEPMTAS